MKELVSCNCFSMVRKLIWISSFLLKPSSLVFQSLENRKSGVLWRVRQFQFHVLIMYVYINSSKWQSKAWYWNKIFVCIIFSSKSVFLKFSSNLPTEVHFCESCSSLTGRTPQNIFFFLSRNKISNFGSLRQTFPCRGRRFRRFNVAGSSGFSDTKLLEYIFRR